MSSRHWAIKSHLNSQSRWDGEHDPINSNHECLLNQPSPVSQNAGEIRGTLERASYMLSIAEKALAPMGLEDTDKPGFKRYIKREPLGVVFVIAPWK